MGASEAIPGVVGYEGQQPLERVQDGAVLRQRLARIILPPQLQLEQRLQGGGARQEHRADRKFEEWRQGFGHPHAPAELLGNLAISVPARQLWVVREYKAELIVVGDVLDDDIRHRVAVAKEVLPQEF